MSKLKLLHWTPRILSILFILFLAMFSLDVFDMGLDIKQTIVALVMHNIPAFILLIVLIISWKYEIVGGIVFILAGLLYVLRLLISGNFEWYMLSWIATISLPAITVGVLFMMSWFKKRK